MTWMTRNKKKGVHKVEQGQHSGTNKHGQQVGTPLSFPSPTIPRHMQSTKRTRQAYEEEEPGASLDSKNGANELPLAKKARLEQDDGDAAIERARAIIPSLYQNHISNIEASSRNIFRTTKALLDTILFEFGNISEEKKKTNLILDALGISQEDKPVEELYSDAQLAIILKMTTTLSSHLDSLDLLCSADPQKYKPTLLVLSEYYNKMLKGMTLQ
jgi:hypothetical protein